MKRPTCFNALLCTTSMFLSTASAQDAAKQPSKSAAPTMTAAADTAEQAGKLREILSYPAEKLHELARERAFKALAALGPGQKLARWSAREQNIQNTRLQYLGKIEKADAEREELRKEFSGEMEQIRRQFAADDSECQRQLLIVIEAYKPQLKELKTDADRWTAEMNETDEQLATIRRNVVGLERDVRLAERGLPFRGRTPDTIDSEATVTQVLNEIGVDFDSEQLKLTLNAGLNEKIASDASAEPEVSPSEPENVQKALAELEEFFE